MFQLAYLIIIVGVIYCIYTVYARRKVNVYIKKYVGEILDEDNFYLVQFVIGILNSMMLIAFGIFVLTFHKEVFYLFLSLIIFHLLIFSIVLVCSQLKFIKVSS